LHEEIFPAAVRIGNKRNDLAIPLQSTEAIESSAANDQPALENRLGKRVLHSLNPASHFGLEDFLGGLDTQPFDCIITGKGTEWLHISRMNDDTVFRALADANRRHLLDRLHAKNGQTLGELCRGLAMTRQAVTKHLSILESANLVSWKRRGREKLHFINPVPINEIAERWINKFEQPRLRALSQLKKKLEGNDNE
jgi:DNA-binding transcriptional ArsR family regulator